MPILSSTGAMDLSGLSITLLTLSSSPTSASLLLLTAGGRSGVRTLLSVFLPGSSSSCSSFWFSMSSMFMISVSTFTSSIITSLFSTVSMSLDFSPMFASSCSMMFSTTCAVLKSNRSFVFCNLSFPTSGFSIAASRRRLHSSE